MADWLSTGAGLLGAFLGSKGNDTKTTSTNAIDPRMGSYIYGNGSNVQGVLPAATDWYQKNQSGLNDQSLQGLNRQWNTASDPNTAQGYTNMQGLGSSLMGGGVAGNPFTTGRASLNGGANLGMGGQPAQPQFQNPALMGSVQPSNSGPFTQPANTWHPQAPQAPQNPFGNSPGGAGGGDYGHNGNGSSAPGSSGENGNMAGFMNNIGLGNPGWGTVGGVLGGLLGGLPASVIGQLVGLQSQGSNDAGGSLNGAGLLGANIGNITGYSGAGYNGWGGTDGLSQALGASAFGTAPGYGVAGFGYGGNGNGGDGGNGGGGDSSRGSQSSNGGRNGGDSGGF